MVMMQRKATFPQLIGHIIHQVDVPGHKGPVKPLNVVKYNSNGTYFMSGGNDKKVNLFNASSGAHINTYEAHGYEITDLDISVDNARFCSVGGDKPVFFWDVAAGSTIRRFAGHTQRVNCVSFNDDASVVVSGSFDATTRIWDTKSNSGIPIQVLDDARDSVTALWVKNHEIITGSVDGKVRTYDLRNGKLLSDVVGQPVTALHGSLDGQTLLISSLDSVIRLLDKSNGGLLKDYKGHTSSNYRIPSVFNSSEEFVITGSEDGRCLVFDTVTGKVLKELACHTGKVVSGLTCHPKSSAMITCGGDGDIILWT